MLEKEIIKKLEIIKIAMSLNEEDIIELQIKKLQEYVLEDKVKEILSSLASDKDLNVIFLEIDEYIKENVEYIDRDVETEILKFQLKANEYKLQHLITKKENHLNDMSNFNKKYHLKVGYIVKKILHSYTIKLEKTIKHTSKILQKDTIYYQEIKETFSVLELKKENIQKKLKELDEFDSEYDENYDKYREVKIKLDTTETEIEEYRKKIKKLRDEIDLFQKKSLKLKSDSKYFNDESKIIINDDLEFIIFNDAITNKNKLRKRIAFLLREINKLEQEIEEIGKSEIFITIKSIDDIEKYFDALKYQFEEKYNCL